ncbi:YgiQ family radical SAM protein [Heliorestis acidaminivorans]|uniref:YgiQ family radical SAM protein n=1 Tax=Heliorestis acidaminivorans TaxID=553427 RepID=A0A6I0F572_9FIRM|nr:YgiQ family radical SAM protein [Heliorestis acidaminivorans]KAB2954653.1 YgiQ family radical SAM protein [Heliorestis acidaminivorans]
MSMPEMEKLGWQQCDFIIVSGDAYVDHPSFGTAIIGRVLESKGYKVGIISQPNWRNTKDFKKLGRPYLGWLITAGNIDSMVNHYTAAKKKRSNDAYSPGGKSGLRPDRATLVYSQRCREAYKEPPIIIGGIEASLRRFAHYDYWDDKVRRSILIDAKADLLIYGMGENTILALADELRSRREGAQEATKLLGSSLQGLCYVAQDKTAFQEREDILFLPSYEEVKESKTAYAKAFQLQEREQNPYQGKTLVQQHQELFLVQNRPPLPMTTKEIDQVFALPFSRKAHPAYEKLGGVPALEEVEFSLTAQRGCFGGCSFCALTFHQGRIIQSRSDQSLLTEAQKMVTSPNFKGYIHDVGGPTANFRRQACKKQLKAGACRDRHCLFPKPCPNLEINHDEYLDLLRKLRKLEGVKKVFIRSGLRYDYLMADKKERRRRFLEEICQHHVSGQLKVAPEHASAKVLQYMGKPGIDVYDAFKKEYEEINKNLGKKQYLVPYLMSSHPGATIHEAIELAEKIRDWRYTPEQVQDFIPTPGSLSTCIYYTGIDPRTMEEVTVPRTQKDKALQRALLQFRKPENYDLVYQALCNAERKDLIGFGANKLIGPRKHQKAKKSKIESTVEKKNKVIRKKRRL